MSFPREQLEEIVVAAAPSEGEVLMTLAEQWLSEGEARGIARGKAEGKAEAIVSIMQGRGLPVSEFERARMLGVTDLTQLDKMLLKAVTASAVSELFES